MRHILVVFLTFIIQLLTKFVDICNRSTNKNAFVQSTKNYSDNEIIKEILAGRETTLRRIYPLYAAEFKLWAKRYVTCAEEDLTDAYQEAIVALYRNISSRRLTTLTSSLKTYIFAVGYRQLKRLMRDQHTKKIEFVAEPSESELPHDSHFLQLLIEEEEYQSQKTQVGQALEQLPPACQKILELYFYHGYTIPQIKEELNYQSENSVSVQKSRCLKSLKDILENY